MFPMSQHHFAWSGRCGLLSGSYLNIDDLRLSPEPLEVT